MKSINRLLSITCLFVLFSRSIASDTQSDLFSLSLEELLNIRISGSCLIAEEQLAVPSSVTVFNGNEIQAMGIDTIEALMEFVPGYQSYQQGESGHSAPYSSRGRKVGTTSREILVLLDGQRIDTTFYGGAPFTMPQLNLGNVESVEFLRGPGSATYGTGAFLGTINIVTSKNIKQFGASIGSHGYRDAHLGYSTSAKNMHFDFYTHAYDEDGQSYQAYDPYIEDDQNIKDPQQGEDLRTRLEISGWEFSYIRSNRYADGFYTLGTIDESFNTYSTQYQISSLRRTLTWNETHSTDIQFSFRDWNEKITTILTPPGILLPISSPPSSAALYGKSDVAEIEKSIFLVHNWQTTQNLGLILGFEQREIDLKKSDVRSNFDLVALSQGNYPVAFYGNFNNSTPTNSTKDRSIIGLFAQAKLQLNPHTELTGGLRFDDDDLVDSRITPRLAMTYRTPSDFVFKVLYSEAFRSPSTVELSTTNNPISQGNPNLDPETVATTELVLMKQSGHSLTSVSLFSNEFKNSIVNSLDDGFRTWTNSSQETNTGIEIEYLIEPIDHLMIRSSLTRIFSSSESSFREAKTLGSIYLSYASSRWKYGIGTSYTGTRMMNTPERETHMRLDPYFKTRASIHYAISDTLSLFINGSNLTDEDIRTPPQTDELIEGIPNRGREFKFGFEASY